MSAGPLKMRDYQEACLKAHFNYFMLRKGNPLFVVPTGGGKSAIIAEFVKRTIEQWPEQRIIILTHVQELIEQNHEEFLRQWGLLAPVGIYSAGLKRRDTDCSVVFAGIQSVWPRLEQASTAAEKLGRFDLALIDEAHLIPKKGEGRYLSYLAWLTKQNPDLKVMGYTATPFRLEGGLLHRGEGRIFTDVAYDVPLKKLVDDGYLVPLVAKRPRGVIDAHGVKTVAGDFARGELERAAMATGNVETAVAEMVSIARAQDRKHWLVFGCGVEHGQEILARVRDLGVTAEIVLGDTPKDERERIIRDAKAGAVTCLVNVGVLTTGFNWPRCDLLAVMRPTQSTALYVQMMGRGMRTFPGKQDCLVLDYGENVLRHGPVNAIRVTEEAAGEKGEAPAKVCPVCEYIAPAAATKCAQCGEEFPRATREARHRSEAGTESPVDFTPREKPKWTLDVDYIEYARHSKEGKPDSLRVSYFSGMRRVSEWICLEHGGFAGRRGEEWWGLRGRSPIPRTVTEALERQAELASPAQVVVQEDGKFERVIDWLFRKEQRDSATAEEPEPHVAGGAHPGGERATRLPWESA